MGTGLRISEFCGLTIRDVDFQNKKITVNKQLRRDPKGRYYITKTKTKSGERFIPMSEAVQQAFQRAIKKRKKPKKEYMIDGISGFIFLTQEGKPKVAVHYQMTMHRILKTYNQTHEEQWKIPLTPHVMRHTFCTDLVNSGMDLKSVQYLMGHSNIRTTLNIYAHSDFKTAQRAFFSGDYHGPMDFPDTRSDTSSVL